MLENTNKKTEKVPQNLPTKAEMEEAQNTFRLDLGYSGGLGGLFDAKNSPEVKKASEAYRETDVLRNLIIDTAMHKNLSIVDAVLDIYAEKTHSLSLPELHNFHHELVVHLGRLIHHLYDSKHRLYIKNTPDLPPDVLTEMTHDQLRLALKKIEAIELPVHAQEESDAPDTRILN